ncbi:MAG TPA: hypothetical protein VNX46_08915, partial [Candidatus Acidoferrum sp.]|nr:hypothetical protein [Candidatus Acidoferrum sp.]
FEITVPLHIKSQIVFNLPKGYHIVEKAAPIQQIDQRFVTFQTHNQEEGGRYYESFDIQFLVGRHSATDYSAYQQTMEQVRSLTENEINLESD